MIPEQLAVPRVTAAFDQEGVLIRSEDLAGLDRLVAALNLALQAPHALVA